MVNLDGANIPDPDNSPPRPNLAVAGRATSFANRPRARSESLRRHQAMSMTFASRSHTPPASFREEDLTRPRLLRQLSPTADSRKKMFQLHSRSHSSPPAAMIEEGTPTVKEDMTDEEGRDRTKSFATDDDETIRDFDFDSPVSNHGRRDGSVRESVTSRQRYVFGRPVPLWMTTRPTSGRITAFIAKYAPW